MPNSLIILAEVLPMLLATNQDFRAKHESHCTTMFKHWNKASKPRKTRKGA